MKPLTFCLIVASFLGSFISLCRCKIIVRAENDTIIAQFPSIPIVFKGTNAFIASGKLAKPTDSDVAGCIVWVPITVPPEDLVRDLQSRGAAAIIMESWKIIPGNLQFNLKDGWEATGDISIVMTQIGENFYVQFASLYKNFTAMGINLYAQVDTSEDVNPWVEIANEPVVIFVQVFIGIVCLVALILSCHKLIELLIYSHRNKCFKETALPLIVLILQVIANAIGIPTIASPFGMRLIFSYIANSFLLTWASPFIYTGALLITCFWHESLSKSNLKINYFLDRLKVGFFVFASIIFAIEILQVIFQAHNLIQRKNVVYFSMAVQAFYGVILVIFYVVTSIRIFRRIRNSTALLSRATKMTSVLFAMGIFLAIASIALILFNVFIDSDTGPVIMIVTTALFYGAEHLASLCLVIAFYLSKRYRLKGSSNSSSKNFTTTNSTHETGEITPQQSPATIRSGTSL
jgi:hypothetical protein